MLLFLGAIFVPLAKQDPNQSLLRKLRRESSGAVAFSTCAFGEWRRFNGLKEAVETAHIIRQLSRHRAKARR
jgi:hypothetical protein